MILAISLLCKNVPKACKPHEWIQNTNFFFICKYFFPSVYQDLVVCFSPHSRNLQNIVNVGEKKQKKRRKKNALRQADSRTPTCLTACCQEIQSQTPTLAVSLRASLPTAGGVWQRKTLSFHLFMASSRYVGTALVNIQVTFWKMPRWAVKHHKLETSRDNNKLLVCFLFFTFQCVYVKKQYLQQV